MIGESDMANEQTLEMVAKILDEASPVLRSVRRSDGASDRVAGRPGSG
jgi:hypothetical protein